MGVETVRARAAHAVKHATQQRASASRAADCAVAFQRGEWTLSSELQGHASVQRNVAWRARNESVTACDITKCSIPRSTQSFLSCCSAFRKTCWSEFPEFAAPAVVRLPCLPALPPGPKSAAEPPHTRVAVMPRCAYFHGKSRIAGLPFTAATRYSPSGRFVGTCAGAGDETAYAVFRALRTFRWVHVAEPAELLRIRASCCNRLA